MLLPLHSYHKRIIEVLSRFLNNIPLRMIVQQYSWTVLPQGFKNSLPLETSPDGPVTLMSTHSRGHRFYPWLGEVRSHMLHMVQWEIIP